MSSSDVIAVINTSPDTVDLLTDALERAGFLVVSSYTHDIRDGKVDLQAFLRVHQPKVIVYDVAPPYERSWEFLTHLRRTVFAGCRFVITSPNAERVARLIGKDERVYEVVGHDDDLAEVVRATREAAKARPTS